ncbi:hypothetical protein ASPBRDRAFT_221860 [Aspergillus brasiliensis CBS 101740]|uniref:Uncharacterized protein n=1 Tax=Aspergillus brasiliensis (strain CBS 101740 / IMI 381727 / IBT 21946) TaxID=767769 RepID=A0A1L9UZI6_ASPBC|nr:hypothetical protein ASPBRDRAFT_221860 [Aspergillus brasiliensis CBS 101740]
MKPDRHQQGLPDMRSPCMAFWKLSYPHIFQTRPVTVSSTTTVSNVRSHNFGARTRAGTESPVAKNFPFNTTDQPSIISPSSVTASQPFLSTWVCIKPLSNAAAARNELEISGQSRKQSDSLTATLPKKAMTRNGRCPRPGRDLKTSQSSRK